MKEEGVKAEVKRTIELYNGFYTMPVMKGYGDSGVPDILACIEGRFFGIECKYTKDLKPTKAQQLKLNNIWKAGGIPMVIHTNNLWEFAGFIGDFVFKKRLGAPFAYEEVDHFSKVVYLERPDITEVF